MNAKNNMSPEFVLSGIKVVDFSRLLPGPWHANERILALRSLRSNNRVSVMGHDIIRRITRLPAPIS